MLVCSICGINAAFPVSFLELILCNTCIALYKDVTINPFRKRHQQGGLMAYIFCLYFKISNPILPIPRIYN
jgi:hypothetical protein